MDGGSFRSSALCNSVRPSVSSARRVSAERRAGSLDQAVPLISITTWAHRAPSVISQSQPRASTPVRLCLPRLALSLPTHDMTLHYEIPRTCLFQDTHATGRSSQSVCGPLIAQVYLSFTNRRHQCGPLS